MLLLLAVGMTEHSQPELYRKQNETSLDIPIVVTKGAVVLVKSLYTSATCRTERSGKSLETPFIQGTPEMKNSNK